MSRAQFTTLGLLLIASIVCAGAGGPGVVGRAGLPQHHSLGPDTEENLWGTQRNEHARAKEKRIRPVQLVPDDGPLTTVLEVVSNSIRGALRVQEHVVEIKAGSHLMPRKWREVRSHGSEWKYVYSNPCPIWLNGKKTLALIPDDGTEPMESEEQGHLWIKSRDTRFFNVTGPLQVLGEPGMRTRVLGCWRIHAPGCTGFLREMALINQEDYVVVLEDGNWRIDRCLLSASGRGPVGTDIVRVAKFSTLLLQHSTIQLLSWDAPNPEWARWPQGKPANGDAAKDLISAYENVCPQGGSVCYGLSTESQTKVVVDSCIFEGLGAAACIIQMSEVSFDRCLFRWNQIDIVMKNAPMVSVRDCEMLDHVYAAFYLMLKQSEEATILSVSGCRIRGKMWHRDSFIPHPANLVEEENELTHRPAMFTEGPGKGEEPDLRRYAAMGKGEFKTDWSLDPDPEVRESLLGDGDQIGENLKRQTRWQRSGGLDLEDIGWQGPLN